MCACQSAVDPLCFAHTSNRYVPAAIPLVFQVAVGVPPYDFRSDHAPPGGWTQNSYCGLGQPVAEPVSPTEAPAVCGEAGLNASVTAEHGAPVWGGYVGLGEMGASQLAVEPDCLAQM